MILGLVVSLQASAQLPFTPPASAVTTSKTTPGEQISGQDANRFVEILVELAWLADPVTCPYFLEARVEGPAVHVRGFVPNISVRDHALKLARLQCPMTVLDDTKVRQGIGVQLVRIPAGQLEKACLACLNVFFPVNNGHFQIQADSAGRIKVTGQVHSLEEKLAVSQELRRLHGCTAVLNRVHVVQAAQAATTFALKPEIEATLATIPPKPDKPISFPVAMSAAPPTQPSRSFWEKVGFAGKKSPPATAAGVTGLTMLSGPQLLGESKTPAAGEVKVVSAVEEPPESATPLVTHGTVTVTDEPALTPAIQMRNHIVAACGIAPQNLQVQFKSDSDLEIRIAARNQEEANTLAQRVFQLPELLPYRVDVQVTIPR